MIPKSLSTLILSSITISCVSGSSPFKPPPGAIQVIPTGLKPSNAKHNPSPGAIQAIPTGLKPLNVKHNPSLASSHIKANINSGSELNKEGGS